MAKHKKKKTLVLDVATQNFYQGVDMVEKHPLFQPLIKNARVMRSNEVEYPGNGLAYVTNNGSIYCHPKRREESMVWARAIAHCLLHLGMGHFQEKSHPYEWNLACDYVVEKFLFDLKFGKNVKDLSYLSDITNEEKLYRNLCANIDKAKFIGFGTADEYEQDMLKVPEERWRSKIQWSKLFASGLSAAVQSAISVAAGVQESMDYQSERPLQTVAYRMIQWFISSYPLLGAIAANFKLVEDPMICQRMEISVGAVAPGLLEIYLNPSAGLSEEEIRFVIAHEFLHVALRHDSRLEWRDPYFWNVACDYVINQWLTEMGIGERPDGVLYDEQFKGMNAEAIYDMIVTDMRRYRKLATLRGVGLGDILYGPNQLSADVDLDTFYRRALAQGLSYHQEQERGFLPAGLVEEIRALSHPPIPWDVELARWFDDYFTPVEKIRSYARPSRRQAATPDIPRPNWSVSQSTLDGRTLGVVLDTSGSMSRGLLATALGAIASYSAVRDVYATRVVFCDADAHDMGYMKPEEIAGTVKVRGRGGTVLQPGIDLLEKAEDFPKEAPILIITDAECDKVIIHGREHAFLIPRGAKLPFIPKGKVFRMSIN